MFINWSIEAFKWIILVKNFQIVSFKNAMKSTTMGIVFGLFTPNRLGEIPGKTILLQKENRAKGTLAASVGSFAQFTVTFIVGLIGIIFILFYLKNIAFRNIFTNSISILLIFLALLILILYFNIEKTVRFLEKNKLSSIFFSKVEFISNYNNNKLIKVLILSLLRYLVFAMQFYLLLLFFNINLPTIIAFSSIFSIFLMINILPNFVVADLGIRGSISIFVLGQFIAIRPEIIEAPVLLWIINIVLPAILGQFFISKIKLKTL